MLWRWRVKEKGYTKEHTHDLSRIIHIRGWSGHARIDRPASLALAGKTHRQSSQRPRRGWLCPSSQLLQPCTTPWYHLSPDGPVRVAVWPLRRPTPQKIAIMSVIERETCRCYWQPSAVCGSTSLVFQVSIWTRYLRIRLFDFLTNAFGVCRTSEIAAPSSWCSWCKAYGQRHCQPVVKKVVIFFNFYPFFLNKFNGIGLMLVFLCYAKVDKAAALMNWEPEATTSAYIGVIRSRRGTTRSRGELYTVGYFLLLHLFKQ